MPHMLQRKAAIHKLLKLRWHTVLLGVLIDLFWCHALHCQQSVSVVNKE